MAGQQLLRAALHLLPGRLAPGQQQSSAASSRAVRLAGRQAAREQVQSCAAEKLSDRSNDHQRQAHLGVFGATSCLRLQQKQGKRAAGSSRHVQQQPVRGAIVRS